MLRHNAVIRVTPEYPPVPKNRPRPSGDVLVEVTIDPDGNVIATRRLKGHPVLYQASERAAKQWRFRPLKEFSEPVDASKPLVGVLTFRFTL
ncbi:MAG: energy transducer TonB [Blastocatellia bacterium]|nr:energy transducer TonB [Blastocatellia bacterium]